MLRNITYASIKLRFLGILRVGVYCLHIYLLDRLYLVIFFCKEWNTLVKGENMPITRYFGLATFCFD